MPDSLQVGQFELRTYGVIVVMSFLAGIWLARNTPRAVYENRRQFMELTAGGLRASSRKSAGEV